jgi:hypothetical protein
VKVPIRKIVYAALAAALAGGVLYLYNELNGNPLSKRLAEQTLERYLKEKYPELQTRISDGHYDFKFKRYGFQVTEIGVVREGDGEATRHRFEVGGFWKPAVVLDGIRADRLDLPAMERLGREAAEEIEALLVPDVPQIKRVTVRLELLKGATGEHTAWSKSLPLDRPMQIHLMLDASAMKKRDVLDAAERIRSLLNEAGYDYERVVLNANVMSAGPGKEEYGAVRYAVSFGPNDRAEDVREFD